MKTNINNIETMNDTELQNITGGCIFFPINPLSLPMPDPTIPFRIPGWPL